MRVHVSCEQELMHRYVENGSSPIISVWWEHCGEFYPAEGWTDFVSIVGSWLDSAAALLSSGGTEEFMFMDGPYALYGERMDEKLVITMRGRDSVWLVPLHDFAAEVLHVGVVVHRELELVGTCCTEASMISDGISRLRNVFLSV